jgi:hypothetical protein
MRVEIFLELGVGVVLLTEQLAGPSASAVEIDENQLVLGFGFGHGLVQGSLKPVLGRSERGQDKDKRSDLESLHWILSSDLIRGGIIRPHDIIRGALEKGYLISYQKYSGCA